MRPIRAYGHLRPPAVTQTQEYAAQHRMTVTDEQAAEFAPVIAGMDDRERRPRIRSPAMIDSGGAGYGHMGRINPATMQSAVSQMRTSADDLAPMTGPPLIAVEHLREAYLGVDYAKTQNLRRELHRQVDQALSGVDGLLTPTTPRSPPSCWTGGPGRWR